MYVSLYVLLIYTMICSFLFEDGAADISRPWAYFGLGFGPIHLNNLQCSGREHRLISCRHSSNTYHHNQDWSVTCNNGRIYKYCNIVEAILIILHFGYPSRGGCIGPISMKLGHYNHILSQWNLRIKGTLGAKVLSSFWRVSSGGRFEQTGWF